MGLEPIHREVLPPEDIQGFVRLPIYIRINFNQYLNQLTLILTKK